MVSQMGINSIDLLILKVMKFCRFALLMFMINVDLRDACSCCYAFILFLLSERESDHIQIGRAMSANQKATRQLLFGSFGLSTKEPYTIMLCPSSLASSSSSVHTSPWHMVRHRNFIFGIHMHIFPPPPPYVHIKYLVILTCSF